MQFSSNFSRFLLLLASTLVVLACGQGFQADGINNQSSKVPTPTPTPSPTPNQDVVPEVTSWSGDFPAGKLDTNCMTNPDYNICLIYKDPVTANGAAFSPALTPSTSASTTEQKIMAVGLKVPKSGPLSNPHFRITDPVKVEVDNSGGWKYPYKGDTNNYVAQLNAFYWVNRQRTYMTEQTGKFFAENKNLSIRAYDSGTKDNAYYNGTGIVLGYRSTGNGNVNVGLDSAVTAHEMGHANLDSAMRGAGNFSNCRDKNGCLGGIHEGQGDVHSFILFPDKGDSLGSYFMNSTGGLRSPASIKQRGITAQTLYNRRGGEVHDMGEAYASVWWEVWSKAKASGKHKSVEVIFTNHLAGMAGNDNFTSAYDIIDAMARQAFPAEADQIMADFTLEYDRMGITLP